MFWFDTLSRPMAFIFMMLELAELLLLCLFDVADF